MTVLPQLDDTIAALASAAGRAARGILRLSGDGAPTAARRVFVPARDVDWPALRRPEAFEGVVRASTFRARVPARLLVWPTRRSYTGQPMVEVHTLGSPPLLEALLEDLFREGVRPARPGEFTMRAFLSGRLDLTRAEAVRDVIDADGPDALDAALRQLAGGLSAPLGGVRSNLLDLLADLEAGLDFVDEDIQFVTADETAARLTAARDALGSVLDRMTSRVMTSGRRRVVLAGLPNAGKSTLFNALAGSEQAIVSSTPGTTRDWLRANIDWKRSAWELVDTAGWEPTATELAPTIGDDVAAEGQRRRAEQWNQADLVVWCSARDANESDARRDAELFGSLTTAARPALRVTTKCDLTAQAVDAQTGVSTTSSSSQASPPIIVSAATGAGLDALRDAIAAALSSGRSSGLGTGSTAARCRESLESARAAVDRARDAAALRVGDELVAVELRTALDELGKILGAVHTDDLLDRIFSRFCIGK